MFLVRMQRLPRHLQHVLCCKSISYGFRGTDRWALPESTTDCCRGVHVAGPHSFTAKHSCHHWVTSVRETLFFSLLGTHGSQMANPFSPCPTEQCYSEKQKERLRHQALHAVDPAALRGCISRLEKLWQTHLSMLSCSEAVSTRGRSMHRTTEPQNGLG